MIRLINYVAISFLFLNPLFLLDINVFLKFALGTTLCVITIWLLDEVSFDDNLLLLALLVSLPYMIEISDAAGVDTNFAVFLGVVFLSVSTPLVLWFLFRQLAEVPEG